MTRAWLLAAVLAATSTARAAPEAAPKPEPPAEVKASAWVVRAAVAQAPPVGERAQLEVTVEARAGFHLNQDYPINFRPATTAQVAFERPRIDRKDGILLEACAARPGETCKARLSAAFVAEAGGSLRVGGTLAFSACDASQCLIEKVQVAATVEATARKR